MLFIIFIDSSKLSTRIKWFTRAFRISYELCYSMSSCNYAYQHRPKRLELFVDQTCKSVAELLVGVGRAAFWKLKNHWELFESQKGLTYLRGKHPAVIPSIALTKHRPQTHVYHILPIFDDEISTINTLHILTFILMNK